MLSKFWRNSGISRPERLVTAQAMKGSSPRRRYRCCDVQSVNSDDDEAFVTTFNAAPVRPSRKAPPRYLQSRRSPRAAAHSPGRFAPPRPR